MWVRTIAFGQPRCTHCCVRLFLLPPLVLLFPGMSSTLAKALFGYRKEKEEREKKIGGMEKVFRLVEIFLDQSNLKTLDPS